MGSVMELWAKETVVSLVRVGKQLLNWFLGSLLYNKSSVAAGSTSDLLKAASGNLLFISVFREESSG